MVGDDKEVTEPPKPTFLVQYVSPLDSKQLNLVCTSSGLAKAQAGCFGAYETPEHKVEINCEIALGAASGPGCKTRVLKGLGEDQDPRYRDYLNPPPAVV